MKKTSNIKPLGMKRPPPPPRPPQPCGSSLSREAMEALAEAAKETARHLKDIDRLKEI